ncbi:hypothetical protein AB0L68_30715 [Streptomyces sp. NPDC052164]|uniref:hypothetical protein n=1 Tax=Streptomyces sp. NPDC052164 TaxID=3155529 RepID=UPI00341811EF
MSEFEDTLAELRAAAARLALQADAPADPREALRGIGGTVDMLRGPVRALDQLVAEGQGSWQPGVRAEVVAELNSARAALAQAARALSRAADPDAL